MSIVNIQLEKEWLGRIAGGDEAAFTQLFGAYKDRIYTIALRLTSSATMSEEIVQDVFVKLWQKRETLLAVEHFRAYLFTATRNHVFNALKRQARHRHMVGELDQDWPDVQSDTDNLLLEKEYREVLAEAVGRLPDRQRQIYGLIKEQGWKRGQVARQLGISEETVKAHLMQAMRSIRAYCLTRLDLYIALALFGYFRK